METPFDLLVIGGGVNGAGIARDAAGRGHKVMLVERGDFAQATSSASSKLIHGGLRYLEHYEFRLVREALAEREVLLRLAPHIIWPMRFVLPHRPEMRPRWMIRLGLFLYDHLARRVSLPGAEGFRTASHPFGAPLKPAITNAFAYSDGWVEDSRLVLLNARDAAARGATVHPRTEFLSADRRADHWQATLRGPSGEFSVTARGIVNAAGPWVQQALGAAHAKPPGRVRLVRGSHIVVPRLHEGAQAYILQNDDRRVVFVIPYEGEFSLIGTTDIPHEGDPAAARCTEEEAAYLIEAVNRQFRRQLSMADIVWRYSGVRPLFDDGADDPSAVTRDYVLKLDEEGPPLLSVYGGKITTFRHLAQDATTMIGRALGHVGTPWTAGAMLPGGDLGGLGRDAFLAGMTRRYPWMPGMERLVRTHGAELPAVIGDAGSLADMGRHFGAGLTQREIDWMRDHEWAFTAQDILWRRTKLGLHMSEAERETVREAMGG
ncbi:glycerol-3-phosphate dehydrogenase [Rhodovarius crocodyli]|uniref:Glycerol-3-phosphate dehydrogenase n=1 Tax=Rhodovarius crocodyli TaxID=1979269 RepID=A0A437M2M2_9PROT|nr:glycerol-3-phosphate dehydrogenase [Rhodovarius crocodyli]RVT91872.1 glycerol-3-phosphate dehydrogenase [Rhodovarius crocodyli]